MPEPVHMPVPVCLCLCLLMRVRLCTCLHVTVHMHVAGAKQDLSSNPLQGDVCEVSELFQRMHTCNTISGSWVLTSGAQAP